jgi:DNA-binding response OmpR family regulator
MRVLLVEDEPYMARAIRDGLRLEAIAVDIARHIVASASGMPILILTAADRLDDKASGFELGADDYFITSRSSCESSCSVATVGGVRYPISTQPDTGRERADRE